MKKIKVLSLIIILIILIPITACSQKPDNNTQAENNNPTQDAGNQPETSDDKKEAADVKLLPDLPENLNLNGYKFRIFYELSEGGDWGVRGIGAEEETGEAINDETYMRNAYITDKYKFEIVSITSKVYDLPASKVKKTVQAGSDEYDVVIIRQKELPALITTGCLANLNDMPGLDFDKPWWDKSIMNQLSISGKQFTAFGDFIVCANDALRILLFNKQIHKDAGLENIYILVKEGKWTLDKFYTLSKDVALDLNGDGKMDTKDRYGLLLQKGSVVCFSFGANELLTSKDKDDIPVLAIGGERSLLALQKIWDVVNAPNLTIYDSAFPNSWADLQVAFENSQGLFFGEVLQLAERMRATEIDFGVVPFPKYDDAQENYYAFGDSNCMNHIIVPNTNRNLEITGQILEALCAESYYTIRPAYYDKSLNGKFMRDEESSEMLDIVLSNKVISLDDMYGWGMFGTIQTALTAKSPNFVSAIEKNAVKTEQKIEKTVALIENLE